MAVLTVTYLVWIPVKHLPDWMYIFPTWYATLVVINIYLAARNPY